MPILLSISLLKIKVYFYISKCMIMICKGKLLHICMCACLSLSFSPSLSSFLSHFLSHSLPLSQYLSHISFFPNLSSLSHSFSHSLHLSFFFSPTFISLSTTLSTICNNRQVVGHFKLHSSTKYLG